MCNRNLTIQNYFVYTQVILNNKKVTEKYRRSFEKIEFINLVFMFCNLKESKLATFEFSKMI